jgi:hypothetical protein
MEPLQPQQKSSHAVLWILGMLVVACIAGYAFFFAKTLNLPALFAKHPSEHLIAGVEYWGLYEGTPITSTPSFIAQTLLSYWGDTRVSEYDVASIFKIQLEHESVDSRQQVYYYSNFETFFEEMGYDFTVDTRNDPDAIKAIVSQDLPVVIAQRLALDAPINITTSRVIIGYSDVKKVFIVHDNNFGNNYEISYEDFESLRDPEATKGFFYIQPSPELVGSIAGPDRSKTYPPRLSIMDDKDVREVLINYEILGSLRREEKGLGVNKNAEIVGVWEDIVFGEGFSKLHPAGAMMASYSLAVAYTNRLKEHQKAVDILEDITIPFLEVDFKEPSGDWDRKNLEIYDAKEWYTDPWLYLGISHYRLGNRAAAETAFKKTISLDPDNGKLKEIIAQNSDFKF